jgi:hypothetical protein
MTAPSVERIARTLLYEGYILYPYRRSAVKNRQRFNFGVIYPEEHSRAQSGTDPCEMQTECLLQGGPATGLEVAARFLHLFERTPARPGEPPWHDAVERTVAIGDATLGELLGAPRGLAFEFPATEWPGRQLAVTGRVDLSAVPAGPDLFRLRAVIANRTALGPASTPSRDEVLLCSLVSTHTILRAAGGEFVSLTDPPGHLQEVAATCRNVGAWPVLAGENGSRDVVLASPIIVEDFPSVAPESPGDFFDGTEMDEMLSLRILTLSDDEKREMAATDERARRLLERTESYRAEELMRMHGVLRQIRALETGP